MNENVKFSEGGYLMSGYQSKSIFKGCLEKDKNMFSENSVKRYQIWYL